MSTKGKILVVDDDAITLKITAARLEQAGFETITRNEALGTTQAITEEQPDLVLMDIRMPALTGDMLTRLIKENPELNKTPIIFHSSEDLAMLQEQAKELGVAGVIAKTDNDALFLAQFERLFALATNP